MLSSKEVPGDRRDVVFRVRDIGVDRMEPFMRERVKVYTEVAKRLGLGK